MIADRQHLLWATAEAARLEHCLTCMYLFAAYSLKQFPEEGVTDRDVHEINQRWRAPLLQVAREEMGHLAMVNGLRRLIGAAPYLESPGFPQPSERFQTGVSLELLPLGPVALDRFIELEAPSQPQMMMEMAQPFDGLGPSLVQYRSVGDLYVHIREMIERVELRGSHLPRPSGTRHWTLHVGIMHIENLQHATKAIDLIIETGEGDGSPPPDAPAVPNHHATMVRIRDDYENGSLRPEFIRPVATNPTTSNTKIELLSSTDLTLTRVEHLVARAAAELFNAIYTFALTALDQSYRAFTPAPYEQLNTRLLQPLMACALKPLGELLSTLPISNVTDAPHAGMTFEAHDGQYILIGTHKNLMRGFGDDLRTLSQLADNLAHEIAVVDDHLQARRVAVAQRIAADLSILASHLTEAHT